MQWRLEDAARPQVANRNIPAITCCIVYFYFSSAIKLIIMLTREMTMLAMAIKEVRNWRPTHSHISLVRKDRSRHRNGKRSQRENGYTRINTKTEGGEPMPRIRQKTEQYIQEDFFREIEARKGWYGCQTHAEFGKLIGVCAKSITNFERDPDSIRLGTFREIIRKLRPNPKIILKFLGYSDQDIKKIV